MGRNSCKTAQQTHFSAIPQKSELARVVPATWRAQRTQCCPCPDFAGGHALGRWHGTAVWMTTVMHHDHCIDGELQWHWFMTLCQGFNCVSSPTCHWLKPTTGTKDTKKKDSALPAQRLIVFWGCKVWGSFYICAWSQQIIETYKTGNKSSRCLCNVPATALCAKLTEHRSPCSPQRVSPAQLLTPCPAGEG